MAVTVGLDLGGTKCLGLALDQKGQVVAETRRPTPSGADAIIAMLADVARELSGGLECAGVGVGAAGLVDARGVLRFAPNLPGFTDLDIRGRLIEVLSAPVVVENDASCAAWAERELGAAISRDDVVVVTIGTGVGGGLILGGELYRGESGFAGEIGHMVIDPHGPPCACGGRGCWERLASGSGLGRLGREAATAGRAPALMSRAGGDPDAVRGEHVTALAAEGDEDALAVLDSFAWWLALGLTNLANICDPEAFVIGGGIIEVGDLLLDPVRRHFQDLSPAAGRRPPVEILPAALGERAGAIGAALLAQ